MAAKKKLPGKTKPRNLKEKGFVTAIVASTMIFFAVFFYYPVIMNIYYMFCDYNLLSKPKFVGLKNIIRFFSDEIVRISFQNTFIIALFSVPARKAMESCFFQVKPEVR